MMIKRWPSRIPAPPDRKITIYGWSTRGRSDRLSVDIEAGKALTDC
jgi:hypothetical protein